MLRSFSMSQVSDPTIRQKQLSTNLKEFLQPIDDDNEENFF
jgi:hypothetical protein